MFDVVKNVLKQGDYNLKDILNKIEVLWVKGKLTDEEHEELVALARGEANPENGINILAVFDDFEKRLRALESNIVKPEEEEQETHPEYIAGKRYYTNDKVAFDGKLFVCVAPEGAVCVWSPVEYPAYWEEVV